jgi:hypothetical protein
MLHSFPKGIIKTCNPSPAQAETLEAKVNLTQLKFVSSQAVARGAKSARHPSSALTARALPFLISLFRLIQLAFFHVAHSRAAETARALA